ncbi:MAG: monovalent cation/H+ antiporter complex subunit F [Gemmatimonadota bacterium]
MDEFFIGVAIFLLFTLLSGLQRILRGPTEADRMLSAQLFGTTGVAITLLLAELTPAAGLRDVALVFTLLAAVNVVAFAHHTWRREVGR